MMLQEDRIVPQTVVRPGSFVGLMALYESNFLRLNRLIPELYRLDGHYRSRVAGDCDLHLEIVSRERYTVTLSLTYFFGSGEHRIADPDMRVCAYLDGQLAEAQDFRGEHQHAGFHILDQAHASQLDDRWRRNTVLNKWLEFLLDKGHLILER